MLRKPRTDVHSSSCWLWPHCPPFPLNWCSPWWIHNLYTMPTTNKKCGDKQTMAPKKGNILKLSATRFAAKDPDAGCKNHSTKYVNGLRPPNAAGSMHQLHRHASGQRFCLKGGQQPMLIVETLETWWPSQGATTFQIMKSSSTATLPSRPSKFYLKDCKHMLRVYLKQSTTSENTRNEVGASKNGFRLVQWQ